MSKNTNIGGHFNKFLNFKNRSTGSKYVKISEKKICYWTRVSYRNKIIWVNFIFRIYWELSWKWILLFSYHLHKQCDTQSTNNSNCLDVWFKNHFDFVCSRLHFVKILVLVPHRWNILLWIICSLLRFLCSYDDDDDADFRFGCWGRLI